MRIAIVDDEQIWIDRVRSYVTNCFDKVKVTIKEFTIGEEFLSDNDDYEIVFMDIEMPGRNGFSILDEYRKSHNKSLFIILTTHTEMSRQGYKVEAFRYIDKYEMGEIKEALSSAMLRLEKYTIIEVPVITYEKQQIPCCNIIYFEVYNHDVLMHLIDGETYKCTETLSDLADRIGEKGFVLTSRSYLINLEHIKKVEYSQIFITGDIKLPISRRRYANIRKIHFDWKMQRTNG